LWLVPGGPLRLCFRQRPDSHNEGRGVSDTATGELGGAPVTGSGAPAGGAAPGVMGQVRGTPAVRLTGVRKSYGPIDAVAGVDLEIAEGEFFTMVGPSGSGKTTLLRLIAGFERPDTGRVELAGRDVTREPPYARDVNTVFQDYALFPHMNVIGNVEYGLRVRRVPKAQRRRQAEAALEMVRLAGLGNRKPVQLSGGQRQRVALARAIVNEPEVLLLDEPLGALDAKLRQDMQLELKRIQREVGISFIYVTHDQEEALTMSDRLAVFNGGLIEQVGSPVDVYERPASDFVADFIGVSNLLERDGRHFTIRPEKVRLLDAGEQAPAGSRVERGLIQDVVYLGMLTRYVVKLEAGGTLTAVRQNLETAAAEALERRGRTVSVAWRDSQTYEIEHGDPAGAAGVRGEGED
jgi:putative spermidine/putrescine transport system ATP-binding protein